MSAHQHSPKMNLAFSLSGLLLLASFGTAAQYPARPIRLLVGFTPGGAADVSARIITKHMADSMGAIFVVENRSGAGGNVAAQIVATATPDGHTLFWGSVGPLTVSPALGVKLPYDPLSGFAPVGRAVNSCNVLVTRTGFQANTVGELVSLAKARPGQMNYASQGIGSTGHLAGELLKTLTGVDIVHVGYKGGSEVVTSVLSGEIALAFVSVTGIRSMGGQAKALATTCGKRDPGLPAVPTFVESGVKNYDATFWYGLLAPANTPTAMIARLNSALGAAVRDATLAQRLETQGLTPAPTSPAGFAEIIRTDHEKWMKVFGGKQP
jgi:tripartite-type tricarboxylate transporter receptor subunit TctC